MKTSSSRKPVAWRQNTGSEPAIIRPVAEPVKRRTVLEISHRQRTRAINRMLWREILAGLLEALTDSGSYEVAVHLVGSMEMTQLNGTFLNHKGSTDVISFDYRTYPPEEVRLARESAKAPGLTLHGEMFISVDDAVEQAARFRTTWQAELVRYAIHGLLHLQGFDDLRSSERYRMRRLEAKWLKAIRSRFAIDQL